MINKPYSRQNLINEICRRYGCGRSHYVLLTERPAGGDVICIKCQHRTVRIKTERFGDGTPDYINWVSDVWVGVCHTKECGFLNLWIELGDQDELDRENRRLLVQLCERELNSL